MENHKRIAVKIRSDIGEFQETSIDTICTYNVWLMDAIVETHKSRIVSGYQARAVEHDFCAKCFAGLPPYFYPLVFILTGGKLDKCTNGSIAWSKCFEQVNLFATLIAGTYRDYFPRTG